MPWQHLTIAKQYSCDELLALMREGARGSCSDFTHADIVDWCQRFVSLAECDEATPDELEQAKNIADDVVVQWELYISGHYSISDMKRFSHTDILLPKNYFQTWIDLLEKLPCAN